MILSCPSCAAQFNVNPAALGETGRSVRCGKCKHQWHATRPLITMPADDLTFTANEQKTSGVATGEADVTQNTIAQNSIAGSTEPPKVTPLKSSFTKAAFDEKDVMASMPAYSSELAPIAKRNAIIAAILLASLLSIPIFMINRTATPEPVAEQHVQTVEEKKAAEKLQEQQAKLTKEQREIVLDGTPTTLLKEEVGRTILSIEGALINKTDKTLPVPVLQAQALNAKGKVVKEWIIPIAAKEMNTGERVPFTYSMPFAEQGVVDIAFHFL